MLISSGSTSTFPHRRRNSFDEVPSLSDPALSTSPMGRGRLSSFDEVAHLANAYPHHHMRPSNLPPMPEKETFKAEEKKNEEFDDAIWDKTRIWEWYNNLPWLAGMNYLPRTAVNFVEMWDESSFDPDVIAEELGWASEKLGYNTLRTNIPMCLYEHDAEGLTKRINKFLRIASRNGFVVMLCPLVSVFKIFLEPLSFSRLA
jgi:hypothetical protein